MKYRIKQKGELFYAQKKTWFLVSWENLTNWEFIHKYDIKCFLHPNSYDAFFTYEQALKAIEDNIKDSKVKIYNL